MKLHYYPETDSLYIELNPEAGAEVREVADGLNVDIDAEGNVVGRHRSRLQTARPVHAGNDCAAAEDDEGRVKADVASGDLGPTRV